MSTLTPIERLLVIIGSLIIGLMVFLPALSTRTFDVGNGRVLTWNLPTWVVLSAIGGSIGGALMAFDGRIAGFVSGIIAGPCMAFALNWYCSGRTHILEYEITLVMIVAGSPGALIYAAYRIYVQFKSRQHADDDCVPLENRRERIEESNDEPIEWKEVRKIRH